MLSSPVTVSTPSTTVNVVNVASVITHAAVRVAKTVSNWHHSGSGTIALVEMPLRCCFTASGGAIVRQANRPSVGLEHRDTADVAMPPLLGLRAASREPLTPESSNGF